MDQMDHEILEKQFKKIENVLIDIYNSLSSTKSTGWFSSETTSLLNVIVEIKNKIDKVLENKNLSTSKDINFESSSLADLKSYVSQLLTVIKSLQQNQTNSSKEIKDSNSLILKSIQRLGTQNAINSIDSAIRDANSQFVNIVSNYRQKFLTFEESFNTLKDTSKNIIDMIETNHTNGIISTEKRNYYIQLSNNFVARCNKFYDSCGLKEKNSKNNNSNKI